ncbi:MAG: hypothetical protein RBR08_10895 [Desulforegulaceae bacterium]|nr:hypothetical protein [Desulforegulaceae bacterium]
MKSFKGVIAALCCFAVFSGQSLAGTINHDLKISGEYELYYIYDDTSMIDEKDNEKSYLEHEFDLKFKLDIGENITMGGKMEYADSTLGDGDHAIGKDNDIEVETAYIKAKFAPVTFTGGKFSYAFPSVFDGSPILDDEGTGVDFDFGLVSVGMLRADDFGEKTEDKNDIYYIKGKFDSDSIKINPYIAYQTQGEEGEVDGYEGDDAAFNSFWIGTSFSLEAGSLNFLADLVYGSRSYSDKALETMDQSGLFLDAAVQMKMDLMTPTAFLIYSTGNDDDNKEHETIPVISPDYEPLNVFGDDDRQSGIDFMSGLAGIGLGVKKLSFMPKLSHDIILFYAVGTNDEKSGNYFTEKDSAMELDFNSVYMLMDNFKIHGKLAYSSIDLDEKVHGKVEDEAGLYCEFGMEFDF